ncbi:TolC family protein [Ferruginibacter sp. HRS2-29]|uniref:TolC family protein n=1 Tax=Ferruginibacter sp. HRS2-29 TaxID=2487334 RepID=UPI0020CEA7EB|nr:TolC family protein [Ferruginibacter sp. HRS2-29]
MIAVLLLAAFCNVAFAQQTKKLTLQEAVSLSIQNSKNLKISHAKIDEAKAMVQQANDAKLPDFNVSGSYLRLSSAHVDLKTGGSGSGSSPSPNQAMYGMATLSLPIYAGGRIKYGIESAKYLQRAAELDASDDKEAVVFNTTKAYVNLYKAAQAVAVVKENLNTSKSRDSNFINLEKNGIMARNDLLKSQLQTSNIELTLLDAENNYKLATVNMNLILGLPENDGIEIDSSFINSVTDEKTFLEYQSLALQNRKDIQALGFRKKAAITGLKSAKAETYPTIGLTGGYIAADIPHLLTVYNAVNIGVGVKYNIASLWKKNTKLMQAKATEAQVNATEELLNDEVRFGVNQDYQNYLLSKKKIDVYQKAIEQATENFRITNNKYNNSLATITDLLEANTALLQAKLNIESAKADVVLAYQKLLQTTGTTNY